jgi:hypothetical protein
VQTLPTTGQAWTTDTQIPGRSPKDLCCKFWRARRGLPCEAFDPQVGGRFAIRETGKSHQCAARIIGALGCVENEQHCGWFSGNNYPQVVTLTYIYELPFGRNKPWLNSGSWAENAPGPT